MKIFGAVLIISGGYLAGRLKVAGKKQRVKSLKELNRLTQQYFFDLKEYRKTMEESFRSAGSIANQLMEDKPIPGLMEEDLALFRQLKTQVRTASYEQSVAVVEEFLQSIRVKVKKIEEDSGSQEKALPLITGTVGFLVTVLMF